MLFVPSSRGFVSKGVAIPSFSFATPALQVAGAGPVVASSPVANLLATTTATVSGGINAQVSATGTSGWGTTASIPVGGTVWVRANASNSWNTSSTCTVTIGLGSATYTLTTATQPNYAIADINNATPGASVTTASVATGSNYAGLPVSPGNTVNGVPLSFNVTATAPNNFNQSSAEPVTMGQGPGAYSDSFNINNINAPTAGQQDHPLTGAVPGSGPYGELVSVSGMVAGPTYTISVSGQGTPQLSWDQRTWYTALTLTSANNGQNFTLHMNAPSGSGHTNTATLTISCGSASANVGTWSVST
jgi:hypothetical protein